MSLKLCFHSIVQTVMGQAACWARRPGDLSSLYSDVPFFRFQDLDMPFTEKRALALQPADDFLRRLALLCWCRRANLSSRDP